MEQNFLSNHFLIAEPELEDPNFRHSVVLILAHDSNGAFGLIINRSTNIKLAEILPELKSSKAGDLTINFGGPVEPNTLFIMKESNEVPPFDWGPFLAKDLTFLTEEWPKIPTPQRPSVRVFLGYSGWGPNQLENELRFHSWKVLPADLNSVFYTKSSTTWSTLLEKFGGIYKIAAKTGFKPSLN
jgi:putative transcriptional regulator